MIPFLLAIAGGYLIGSSMNENNVRYKNGGYIKNIKKLYEEDGSDVYRGDFGEEGSMNWRINKEKDYLYLMGIGRNNRGSIKGKSKGEGSRAIAYLFFLYPKLNVIYFDIEGEEGAWQFYKKIGAEEEGGGEITEDTYNAQITRKSLRKYFKNKDIFFSFDDGGLTDDEGNSINFEVGDTIVEYKRPTPNQSKREYGGNGKIVSIVGAMAKVVFQPNNYEQWIALKDMKKVGIK